MTVRPYVPYVRIILVVLPFVTSQKNPTSRSSVGREEPRVVSSVGRIRKEEAEGSKKSSNKIVRSIMVSTVENSRAKKDVLTSVTFSSGSFTPKKILKG